MRNSVSVMENGARVAGTTWLATSKMMGCLASHQSLAILVFLGGRGVCLVDSDTSHSAWLIDYDRALWLCWLVISGSTVPEGVTWGVALYINWDECMFLGIDYDSYLRALTPTTRSMTFPLSFLSIEWYE